MNNLIKKYDCVIIGGGMFGLYAASLLSSQGAKVAILEKEKDIFDRASKVNQSKIHNGYHYPRSFETAKKTSDYYSRFCDDFKFSLVQPLKQYYAIAREGSKTSIEEYIQFCKKLDIPLREIDSLLFFKKGKVSATFEVEESCFDYLKVREYFLKKLVNNKKVDIYYRTFPTSYQIESSQYVLTLNNALTKLSTKLVINTTYNNVNEVNKMFHFPSYKVKYELCELTLYNKSKELANMGLTVIDGQFFSIMPFQGGEFISLSSVRFTPIHTSRLKPQDIDETKSKHREKTAKTSNWKKIGSLARDYLREGISLTYNRSLFEIKPIFTSAEDDDSRPTLVTIHSKKPYFISVLPGKISTIYDLDKKINSVI
jgi:glycine/D-amino acid oxidase-like deaminating enzyme